jgi:hypothetical protein
MVEGEGQSLKGSSQKLVDLGFNHKFSVEEILTASVGCALEAYDFVLF